ncbi:MAG: hypothetical protein ACPGOV_03725 [Magnetovibrionaceae bacterium]
MDTITLIGIGSAVVFVAVVFGGKILLGRLMAKSSPDQKQDK